MFKFLLRAATVFYYFTLQQLFNVTARSYWYTRLFLTGKIKQTRETLKTTAASVQTFVDVNNIYSSFKYQYDGIFKGDSIFAKWPTWEPTAFIMVARGLSDNCDGGVVLAQFLFKELQKKHPELENELYMKKHIIVPYNSWKSFFYRTHYVYEVISKTEGWSAIYSSGKIAAANLTEFSTSYTHTDKYVIW